MSGHAKMPPASHQVSATSLKLLIQQIHPHVRVERDSGMCVARGLYELSGAPTPACLWPARRTRSRRSSHVVHDTAPIPGTIVPGARGKDLHPRSPCQRVVEGVVHQWWCAFKSKPSSELVIVLRLASARPLPEATRRCRIRRRALGR